MRAPGTAASTVEGELRRLKARSGDGRVHVHTAGRLRHRRLVASRLETVPLLLEVPDGFGVELDATTGDGRVDVRGVPFERVGRTNRERRPGPDRERRLKITIRSGDGSIVVRRGRLALLIDAEPE